ncbi:MAG: DUF177 domain-containing protein [Ruminococcaceae bacterium]|nr:DUF177 domain-containing protein [Oscillospiraceae bacterium]
MTVDLLSIANIEGKALNIEDVVDLSALDGFDFRFKQPVKVSAKFVSLGGSINLSCKASAVIEYICDRCLAPFEDTLEIEFSEVLKKETPFDDNENKNPDIIFYTGNSVELDEIVYNNIYMNLPSKKLCKDDCKGLCIKCGKNLNEGECSCDTRETDPRFDVLDKFFE